MESRRPTAAERDREARERAARRGKISARIGAAGVVVLFGGGIGVILSPANAVLLLGVMGAGIGLLAVAFALVRTPIADLLRTAKE